MRRTTDEDAYNEKLQRQLGPGSYFYKSPTPGAPTVFPDDPWIRPQFSGATLSTRNQPVDVETNLRGVGLPLGRAPMGATSITGASHHHADTNPIRIGESVGRMGGVGGIFDTVGGMMTSGWTVPQIPVPHLQTTHARLELPPLALKGLTPNRFDPVLFHNPAEEAFAPFDREVSTRLVSKDQWRVPKSSLRRLAVSQSTIGNPEGNVPPVYGTTSLPGDDPRCQAERSAASNSYIAKAVITEPNPGCSLPGSAPPSSAYAPPPVYSAHRTSTPLPAGFVNRSRFSTPSSANVTSGREGFQVQVPSSAGGVSGCEGSVSLEDYRRKIVYTESSPVCN